jgi:acyl-homoserine lactone acylase PvdQ
MTNADSNRLDRIETLLSQTVELIRSVGQRTDSNARAIEALSDELRTFQVEAIRDRSRLYQAMADLAQAQAQMAQTHAQFQQNIYQRQSELDIRQNELSRRQGEIVEILKILTQQRD